MTAALIPGGQVVQSYACVRSLSNHGIDTIVASAESNPPTAASRFCTESVLVSDPEEDFRSYKEELLDIARRPAVDTVVPIRPHDTYLLSRYRAEFDAVTDLAVPSLDRYHSVNDRVQLAQTAEKAGVPVPETSTVREVEDWSGKQIVKSRYNMLGDSVDPGRDPADISLSKSYTHLAAGERPDADALREAFGHDPLVQEYVPSTAEYMIGALYDHGDPLAMFQHRQIRGDSYTGGGGVYRESVDIPELADVAHSLLDELDWHGLACIEYMRHEETDEFVLTEINPRLWQSLASARRAGAEFPLYYWYLATGRRDLIDCDYELGVGTHYLYGEVSHLLSILQSDSPNVTRPSIGERTVEILESCLREPSFDYLALDDPWPFVSGVGNVVSNRKS